MKHVSFSSTIESAVRLVSKANTYDYTNLEFSAMVLSICYMYVQGSHFFPLQKFLEFSVFLTFYPVALFCVEIAEWY